MMRPLLSSLAVLTAASVMVALAVAPAGGAGGAFGLAQPSIQQIPGYHPQGTTVPSGGRSLVIGPDHRPVNPWWSPGGAIRARVAIAVVAAKSAPAWGQPAPGEGYCWYFTDAGRSEGFWDVCPRRRR